MSTILVGVDETERSEDATAFALQLTCASGARLVVASSSAARALHDLAESEHAALVAVGSTHVGRRGRVLPGSTGERLIHGAPCPVAVVPRGYRESAERPIRRIGVAYDHSDESRAAVNAAVDAARALRAEIEVVTVLDEAGYGAPMVIAVPASPPVREEIERHVREDLDALVAGLPDDVPHAGVLLEGDPARELAARSARLDLLVVGSRGYGPLRSVLVGGVSGRVVRDAQCPVIVVPRGIEAPLRDLFGAATATA